VLAKDDIVIAVNATQFQCAEAESHSFALTQKKDVLVVWGEDGLKRRQERTSPMRSLACSLAPASGSVRHFERPWSSGRAGSVR
jgi:hypothetical protein